MVHHCSAQPPNGCLNSEGLCKRGYTSRATNNATSFDTKGYPIYYRPNERDLKVVPHNKKILLEWQGHSNVEYCGKTYSVLYLYNYLFKGNQKISFELNNTQDVDPKDEINLYLRGRMLSSMDCCWRAFGYQTYPAPTPTVTNLKVKSPQ